MADTPPHERADGAPPMHRAPSSAERERVIAQLGEAFAHDLVPLDEYELRVDRAYQAATPAALRALVDDLGSAGGVAHLAPATAGEPATRIGAVLTNVERGGPQVVPARLEVRALLANVELDLSRARLSAPFTVIDVRCVMANVEIRLPAGVRVDDDGSAILGTFQCVDAGGHVPRGAPVVRVVGRATLGSVTVSVAE